MSELSEDSGDALAVKAALVREQLDAALRDGTLPGEIHRLADMVRELERIERRVSGHGAESGDSPTARCEE